MAELKLRCGSVLVFDDIDLPLVEKYSWTISWGYVTRKTTVNKKDGVRIGLHRIIMGAKEGQIVDHVNGDILDNRRENLRFATNAQNSMNTRKTKKLSSSLFKGVTWNKSVRKWQAQIQTELLVPRNKYLGVFDCEHEAGHAYNKAAVEIFGDFACLNPVGFPQ